MGFQFMDKTYYKDLVKIRLERAKELYDEANVLLQQDSYKSANNRAFYSIEKSIKALLATKHTDATTHNGALKQFNYYFIHEGDGTFTKEDYSLISQAEQIRSHSDYDDFYIANKEEARKQVKDAGDFLKKVTSYLEKTQIE